MSFRPFSRIFGSKALSALETKIQLSRQNQKTIVIIKIFVSSVASALKVSKPSNSISA